MSQEHISNREFGQLEQKVDHLETRMERVEGKVDKLLELANTGKGAWWAATGSASVTGGVIAWLVTIFFSR